MDAFHKYLAIRLPTERKLQQCDYIELPSDAEWDNYLCTAVYSDTLFSNSSSTRGNKCAQIFVINMGHARVYPMNSKADAYDKLDLYCLSTGIPNVLITDNAGEEASGMWNSVQKKFLIQQHTTEPYSPWQNKAEREIPCIVTVVQNSFGIMVWSIPQNFAITYHSKALMAAHHLNQRQVKHLTFPNTSILASMIGFPIRIMLASAKIRSAGGLASHTVSET